MGRGGVGDEGGGGALGGASGGTGAETDSDAGLESVSYQFVSRMMAVVRIGGKRKGGAECWRRVWGLLGKGGEEWLYVA